MLSTLLFAWVLLAFAAAPADAALTRLNIGTFGSAEEPTFDGPVSLAVDQATGDVLVLDDPTDTLRRYHSDGTPAPFTALGTHVIDGAGGGECPTVPADCDQTPQGGLQVRPFALTEQVAIDESGGATAGNIYVIQTDGDLVDIFSAQGAYLGQLSAAGTTAFQFPCGVAVDLAGAVYVAEWLGFEPGEIEGVVHRFVPSTSTPANADQKASFTEVGKSCGLAAGRGTTSGSLFVNRSEDGVLKIGAVNGAPQYVFATDNPSPQGVNHSNTSLAIDPSNGHVLVVARVSGLVKEYDASGPAAIRIASFGSGAEAVAAHGASSRVYLAPGSGKLRVYGPLVPIPDVLTGEVTDVALTSATLNGTVNPDGEAVEECLFEYGATPAYGQSAPCAETPAQIGSGTSPIAVHADIASLTPEATYHYRLVAKNPNGIVRGADAVFRTPAKPTIAEHWAHEVVFTEATLQAVINPERLETTYRFEWGLDSSYGNSTAAAVIGPGTADHTVTAHLKGLLPGTTYHWRVVATNELGVTESADRTLTTYRLEEGPSPSCPNDALRIGPAAKLPDCRAYELVSPLEKNNADVFAPYALTTGAYTGLEQSTPSGNRFTYSSATAFGDPDGSPMISQYLAERSETGWASEALVPPRTRPPLVVEAYFDNEFKAFSEDLCSAWLRSEFDPPLAPGAAAGFRNLYRRENCGAEGYETLSIGAPPHIVPGTFESYGGLQFVAAAEDPRHSLFVAPDNLTPNAGAQPASCVNEGVQCRLRLYEHLPSGELRFVCVLPSDLPTKQACYAGTADEFSGGTSRQGSFQHTISPDGQRIFWTESSAGLGAGRIYLKVAGESASRRISQAVSGARARFWGAAADGSRAIFAFEDNAVPALDRNLYTFDVERLLAEEVEQATLIAEDVKGVLGMSEDARRVYFASTQAIAGAGPNSEGEEAITGGNNIYLWVEGEGEKPASYAYVATLDDAESNPFAREPNYHTARVSPDGEHLAFMSTASLTGYDNADAVSGEDDAEIFLYEAAEGELRCVSCNPSGARPQGIDRQSVILKAGKGSWQAAQIPTWERPYYASRALSEDGKRLFFESWDALLPRDVNGAQDVYQWEAEGHGSCDAQDVGYHIDPGEASGGCVELISSGQSPSASKFLDADPSGENVFFATESSLIGPDYGLIDVYDARVGGGFPEPEPAPPCEGEACQSPPAAPEAPAPATEGGAGAGNVDPKPASRPRCPKGKRRALRRGRRVCVKRRSSRHRASRNRRSGR